MKHFLLICKNWFKSILNLKIVFILFIIINVIFGAVLSVFLEVNEQMNKQLSSHQRNIASDKRLLIDNTNTDASFNAESLFCTNFTETKKGSLIKRDYKFTINDEGGCLNINEDIKPSNYEFPLYDGLSDRPRILRLNPTMFQKEDENNFEINFNKKNIYFQRSLYNKLLNLYKKTKNPRHLEALEKIKLRIKQHMFKKIKYWIGLRAQQTSFNTQVRQNEINTLVSMKTMIDEIKNMNNLTWESFKNNSYNLINQEKNKEFLQFSNAQFLSNNKINLIKEIIQKIENHEEAMIRESKRVTSQLIDTTINNIKKWNSLKLLGEWNYASLYDQKQYDEFIQKLNDNYTKDKNKENANSKFKKFIKDKLNSSDWRFVVRWIEEQKEIVGETEQKNWILSNFFFILTEIKTKINTNKNIITWQKTTQFIKLLDDEKDNLNLNKDEFKFLNLSGQKLTFEQIISNIENKKLTTQQLDLINEKIEKLKSLIKKYKSVAVFLKNYQIWKKLINRTMQFIKKKYKQTIFEKYNKKINKIQIFLQNLKDEPTKKINDWMNSKILQNTYNYIWFIKEAISFAHHEMTALLYKFQQIKKDLGFEEKMELTFNKDNLQKIQTISDQFLIFDDVAKIDLIEKNWQKFLFLVENQKLQINKISEKLEEFNQFNKNVFDILEKQIVFLKNKIKEITGKNQNEYVWLKNIPDYKLFDKLDLYNIYLNLFQKNSAFKGSETTNPKKRLDYLFAKNIIDWIGILRVVKLDQKWKTNQFNKTNTFNNKNIISVPNPKCISTTSNENDFKKKQECWDNFFINSHIQGDEFLEKIYGKRQNLNLLKIHLEYQEKQKISWIKTKIKSYWQFNIWILNDFMKKKIQKYYPSHINGKLKKYRMLIRIQNRIYTINDSKDIKIDYFEKLTQRYQEIISKLHKKNNALNWFLPGLSSLKDLRKRMLWPDNENNFLNIKETKVPTFWLRETFIFQLLNKYINLKNWKETKRWYEKLKKLPNKINEMKKKGFNTHYYEVDYTTTKESEILQKKTKIKAKDENEFDNFYIINDPEMNLNEPDLQKELNDWILKQKKRNRLLLIDKNSNAKNILKETKKINIMIKRIILELNNFDGRLFVSLFIKNEKINKKFLIVNNEDSNNLNIKLFSGNNIVYNNEIIISPTYARNNQIKIGDTLNILGVKNLRVVGIGVQREFFYPLIDRFGIMPQKNEGIIYTNESLFDVFDKKILGSIETQYAEKKNILFINHQNNLNSNREKDILAIKNYFELNGYNKTKFLWQINEQSKIKNNLVLEKDYETNAFQKKLWTLKDYPFFPYQKIQYFVNANYQVIKYSSIIAIVLVSMIVAFVTFYMVDKKIKNNFKQIGILKSMGVKDWKILMGALPLIVFVIWALVIGWIIGIFLQLNIFEQMESTLNFTFKKYYFNFSNLFIAFGIVFGVIFLTFCFYKRFKFQKMGALQMINPNLNKKTGWIERIKNKLIKKSIISKFLIVKINYLFFAVIWKKMFVILIVMIMTSTVILGFIFILSIKNETIKQNYKNINYKWEMNFLEGTSGNPWSRRSMYINRGFDDIKNSKDDSLKPLSNWGLKLLMINEKGEKREHQINDVISLFHAYQPLYGKVFNYNWIIHILDNLKSSGKTQEEREIKFCLKLFSVLKAANQTFFTEKKRCLQESLQLAFPIKLDDKQKAIKHFPFGVNNVSFNPEKDEFFTRVTARIKRNNFKEEIYIYGVSENTKSFNFATKSKKRIFNSKNSKNQIPVIANSNFLKKHNFKVGDTLEITPEIRYLTWHTEDKNKYTSESNYKKMKRNKRINSNDWYYEDGDKKTPLSDIPADARWYSGKNFKTNIKGFSTNKKGDLLYSTKQGIEKVKLIYHTDSINGEPVQTKEWLEIEKVVLINSKTEEKIYPFRQQNSTTDSNDLNNTVLVVNNFNILIQTEAIKHFSDWFSNKEDIRQLIIVDEIKEYGTPKLFMDQGMANEILGFNRKKNQYGQYEWFNGKWSNDEKIDNVFFHIALASKWGFVNTKIIDLDHGKTFIISGIDPVFLKRTVITQIINYFININLIFLISVSVITVMLFFLLIIASLKEMQKISLKLKILGCSNKILFLNTILIIGFPAVISFIASWFLTKYIFTSVMTNISSGFVLTFFYDGSIFTFSIAILIMFFFLINIIWYQFKKIRKSDLVKVSKI